MRVVWSDRAIRDLERLRRFLASANPRAATQAVAMLRQAPRRLVEHPRLGVRHEAVGPEEIRKLIIGTYEMRYEVFPDMIFILRIFHAREDRH